jgi:phthalate 4,5-cis-dihydrodiol dehydrogenase
MSSVALRIGVAGLGRAFTLMLPTFLADRRVRLVAACDPVESARARFEQDFNGPAYDSVEQLCRDDRVQIVYIATPHQLHAAHVQMAAAAGKHILVEKPMAITLDECSAMIAAARQAGVRLIVGHSHSFNTPILRTRELIAGGRFGGVRMITALNFTDFMYRPRRPEELDSQKGGGVVHSQAAHQIDIIRLLAQSSVRTVHAHTGAWDPARPTEGSYSALLGFEDGSFACASYSGYAHFDSDVLMNNISEIGTAKNPTDYGRARRRLAQARSAKREASFKASRNYGGSEYEGPASAPKLAGHQHFGLFIVSCDRADLRPTAQGIAIDSDDDQTFVPLPDPGVPRKEVIDEVYDAVVNGRPPLHCGIWARATTEVCLGILESARTRGLVRMRHQPPRLELHDQQCQGSAPSLEGGRTQ